MKSAWFGVIFTAFVIYLGIVHPMGDPRILFNAHAMILVIGGTFAVAFLTYPVGRLLQVFDFVILGFLFRIRNSELVVAQDLISKIDLYYKKPATFKVSASPHPFMIDAFKAIDRKDLDMKAVQNLLLDRRNTVRRHYLEDAKILNNLAKYPPHLGLLGAASGMIEMMSGLGVDGIRTIGASMAVALTATLWGIALNNFIFLPLSDNSQKAAEDEIYLRDIMIECCLQIKKGEAHEDVVRTCLNRLSLIDRIALNAGIMQHRERVRGRDAA